MTQRLSASQTEALKSLTFKDVKPVLEKAGVKRDVTEENYLEKLGFAIKLGMVNVSYTPTMNIPE